MLYQERNFIPQQKRFRLKLLGKLMHVAAMGDRSDGFFAIGGAGAAAAFSICACSSSVPGTLHVDDTRMVADGKPAVNGK